MVSARVKRPGPLMVPTLRIQDGRWVVDLSGDDVEHPVQAVDRINVEKARRSEPGLGVSSRGRIRRGRC